MVDSILYEEEMIRLAAELSLQEEKDQENHEYTWDPINLDSVRVKLRVYEEILDGIDFATPEFGEEVLNNNNNILSDEDLREIFFSAGVPEEEIRLSASTPGRSLKRDRKGQDTVSMICRGLSWYQSKIVDEIQLSHETADLTGLLDLQDYINGLLERADLIASGYFSDDATPTVTPSLHMPVPISSPSHTSTITSPSAVAGGVSTTLNASANKQHHTSCVPSVVAAVYAVKRGGNRDDIAAAVLNLAQLCQLNNNNSVQLPPRLSTNTTHNGSSNVDMNVNVVTIKQMASAGALQALLSLLPKAHDWPEIELQIFKIVSMLVSYEEDWALLQRSAMVILTSLYTLQLKSQSRARTRSIPPTMLQSVTTTPTLDEPQQQDIDRQQGLLIRELVSAAIDKLSIVLSSEWSQQTNLIGNLPFLNTTHNSSVKNPSYIKRPGGNNLTGNSIGNNGNSAVGNGNNSGEADAILQIMLNLIIFIWESATLGEQINVLHGSGSDVTSLKLLLLGYKDELTNVVANNLFNHVHTSALLPPPLRVINNSTNVSRQQSEDITTLLSTLPVSPPIFTSNTYNSNSDNNKHIASTSDEFLQRVFHVTLEQLLNGDCPPPERIRHQLIDNSAVLCSAALANLAEIPQCRPGLVARGALKLIKSWLDVCMMMLEVAKRIVFDHIHSVMNHSHFYEAFFKLFGPTYELLINATEALMFLAGGNHNNAHTSLSSTSGGRDYIVGWVDAQILAEELPDMMVKLVMTTFENSFATAVDGQTMPTESFNRTRAVLPLIVSMNVAQTLFQLCSRTQNRHRLQGISIPYVLSMIFEHAFGYIPEVMGLCIDSPRGRRRPSVPPPLATATTPSFKSDSSQQQHYNTYSLDDTGEDGHRRQIDEKNGNVGGQEFEEEEDPVFLQIFEFGKSTLTIVTDGSSIFSPSMPRSVSRLRHSHLHPHHHPTTARLSQTSLSMIQTQHNQHHHTQKAPPVIDHTDSSNKVMLNLLSCVAAATLNALNNYLADEASQQHYHNNTNDASNSNIHSNSGTNNTNNIAANNGGVSSSVVSGMGNLSSMTGGYLIPVDISINTNFLNSGNIHMNNNNSNNTNNNHANSSSTNTANANNIPSNLALLELIGHVRMVQALLSATSHLGKSAVGRLSCVRLISSLTEWPETLKALYEGSVMDTLLVIIYEAEECDTAVIPAATNSSTKSLTPHNPSSNKETNLNNVNNNNYNNNIDRDESSFSFFSNSGRLMPGKPSNVERNTSGNSTISAISSSVNSTIFHMRMTGNEYYNHSNNHNALGNSITEEDSTSIATCNLRQNEMLQEEMMCVCCALANLCCSQHVYAQRMFQSGLVTLMTRLVRNVHFETSRQALRCMHAMAKAVVTEEEAQQANAMGKNYTSIGAGHSTSQKQLMTSYSNNNYANNSSNSHAMGLKYAELFASLDTIMVTLSSQSVLIQIEAVKTIAQLALINEEFQDKIVDECLRQIVTLLVHPKSDRELRQAIEEVLKSLGFSAGHKDFEICGYDFELLRDWYAIQRSMKPQETSMLILRDWIHRLFPSAEDINNSSNNAQQEENRMNMGSSPHVKSSGSFSSNMNTFSGANSNNIASPGGLASPYHHSELSAGSEFHLLQETAAILHAQVDASTSMPAYLVKDHPNSHNTSSTHHATNANNNAFSQGSGKTLASLAMPQLHRHLTDSLSKLWPFCGPPKSSFNNNNNSNIGHHNHNAGSHSSNGTPTAAVAAPSSSAVAAFSFSSTDNMYFFEDNDNGRNRSRDSPFQSQHMTRTSLSAGNTPTSNNQNNSSASNLGGVFSATQPTVIPAATQSLLNTVAVSLSAAYASTTNSNANNANAHLNNINTMVTSSDGNHDWIDKPPAIVVHLLDLFYTSRIHQLILMDLTSIGASIPIPHPQGDDTDEYQFFSFLIPVPHPIKAVLLPPRGYTSFSRVGRVLQRMLEYNPQLLVSLTFRDSNFEGEFHTTLLETLQKCPNIVSLSFANAKNIEEDALLGHLVGQLPSSVRFVSFKGSLSRPSVETLCVMLRSGSNAAFVPMNNEHPHYNHYNNSNSNSNDWFVHNLHAQGSYLGRNIMRRPSSNKTQEEFVSATSSSTAAGKKKLKGSKHSSNSNINAKLEILNNTRGLLGIALTHLSLDQNCIQKIAEMLNPKTHFVKSPFYALYSGSGGNSSNTNNISNILAPRRGDSNPSLLNMNHHPTSNSVSGANTPSSPNTSFVSSLFGGSGSSRKAADPQVNNPTNSMNTNNTATNNRSGTPSSMRYNRDSESETSSPAGYNLMSHMPGLKYLDLSHNDLQDAQCALLMSSAMKGPLEGLELGGNHIFMGQKLLDVFYEFHPERMLKQPNRIRYLGLSQNHLHVSMVTKMLNILQYNSSLTSLDLSANQLDGTIAMLNEALYNFLCNNEGLRVLNLSYNRLTTDTYRKIQLGILQNTTLLMLPTDGNPRAEIDRSLAIVQEHLKKNRLRYIAWSHSGYAVLSRNNIHNNVAASASHEHQANQEYPAFYYYQTEDVHSRLTFSDYGDFVNHGNNHPHHTELDEDEDNENSGDELSEVTEDLSKSRNHHHAPNVTSTTAAAATAANSTAAVVAIPVAQVEGAVSTVSSAHVVSHNIDNNSSSNTQHHNNLTLTLPRSSYHHPQPPHPATTSRDEDMPLRVHPLAPISPTVITTTRIPALAPSNSIIHNLNNIESRRRTTSQPPPMSSANVLSYNSQQSNSLKMNNPNTTGNVVLSSALSAGPISMVYVPPKANNLSSASTHTASAADTSLVLDQNTNHSAVYRTNTLHVLFSAPLAGYDRQGKAHPMEVLDYASERDALIQVFKETRRDVSLHFDFATTNTLRTILSFGARALHFSGHGLPNGLCFEDGRSGLQIVGAAQLKDLLGAGGLSLKFVFVSACYSREIGEAFIRAGVSHVVCVKIDSKIQDSAAMAFTRAFYIAFLSGRSVKASFAIAKEALKASPYVPNSVVEGEKFVLLPDETAVLSHSTPITNPNNAVSVSSSGKIHEEVIFAGAGMVLDWPQPGMCTIGANRMDVKVFQHFHGRLPRPPADFEGREVQMNGLVRHLLDRRLVSLVGEDGMGKSSVAAAVCRYMGDRELFKQSIVYVKGKGVHDFHSFLKKLKQELIYGGLLPSGSMSGSMSGSIPHVSNVSIDTNILPNNVVNSNTNNNNIHVEGVAEPLSGMSSTMSKPDTSVVVDTPFNNNNTTIINNNINSNMNNNMNINNLNNTITQNSTTSTSSVVLEEDIIFAALRDTHLLLVFDSLDTLLGDYRGAVTDLRLFLHRLFDECSAVKVLNVGVDTLMFHNINMATANAVEYSVTLGPLTIASTLRLFARLAPSLITAQEKQVFIANLLPTKQAHCSVQSREANKCTLAILRLLGDGHPAKIVHMACESTSESVEKLTRDGLKIRRQFDLLQNNLNNMHAVNNSNANTNNNNSNNNGTSSNASSTSGLAAINIPQHGAHNPSGITTAIANNNNISTTNININVQQQPLGGIMADLAAFSIVRPTPTPIVNNTSNTTNNVNNNNNI